MDQALAHLRGQGEAMPASALPSPLRAARVNADASTRCTTMLCALPRRFTHIRTTSHPASPQASHKLRQGCAKRRAPAGLTSRARLPRHCRRPQRCRGLLPQLLHPILLPSPRQKVSGLQLPTRTSWHGHWQQRPHRRSGCQGCGSHDTRCPLLQHRLRLLPPPRPPAAPAQPGTAGRRTTGRCDEQAAPAPRYSQRCQELDGDAQWRPLHPLHTSHTARDHPSPRNDLFEAGRLAGSKAHQLVTNTTHAGDTARRKVQGMARACGPSGLKGAPRAAACAASGCGA